MPRSREIRIGLVLYGGVSLAVYENGVAQELYRAIRGDGVYGLLKEWLDADIVVDIMSGTSAGGVNGVMLAYALANGTDFTRTADLWRNEADIESLMRKKDDSVTDSILDSGYYQRKLQACFADSMPAKPAPYPSAVPEIDLFVTGTNIEGDIYTVYDDVGHPIDVKNHRALFQLCYRGDRKNNFKPDPQTQEALARLCRLTSCFPVAFQPVSADEEDDEQTIVTWGKLKKSALFLDGGILHNKPFTSTIDAIARRTANRCVERYLVYVEPDPEKFPSPGKMLPPSPPIVQAGISALLSIPRYQSIAGDLDAVDDLNAASGRVAAVLQAIGQAPMTQPECIDRVAVHGDLQRICADDPAGPITPYYMCRLVQLRDRAVDGILNTEKGRQRFSNEEKKSGRLLVAGFATIPEQAAASLLEDYDVYFRMRRVSRLCDALMEHAGQHLTAEVKDAREVAWNGLNHYFKLLEIVEAGMFQLLDRTDFGWRTLSEEYPEADPADLKDAPWAAQIRERFWFEVQGKLDGLLRCGIALPPDFGRDGRETFYRNLKASTGLLTAPAGSPTLLNRIDAQFGAWLKSLKGDPAALLRNEFCRFLQLDAQTFPIIFGAQLDMLSPIRIVRFSPMDAQKGMSQGPVEEKVCGLVVGAFGGFFKKSWRANDIMVGRMDAACQLIELLTKRLPAGPPQARFAAYMGAWDGTGKLDRDALVHTVHREILAEEWPQVVRCAIEQEWDWGQYARNDSPRGGLSSDRIRWMRSTRKPDRVLVTAAAHAWAAGGAMPVDRPRVAGYPFFDEIPLTTLMEQGTLATMRVDKSLLASLDSKSEIRRWIEGSALHTWLFGVTVPFLYNWNRLRRTQPDWVVVLNTGFVAFCLALFAAGVALCWIPTKLSHPTLDSGALIIASFVLFWVWARLLNWNGRRFGK